MNMQNKAKKLIEMIQTASVEWKPLGEVFDLKNGYTPSKSIKEYWENGSIPWFRMEDIRENGRILDSALQQISESAIKGGKLFPANSIIMATSATIGEHALITVPFLANQRFTNLSLKPEFTDKFDIYFLYYYCFNLSDWCKKNTTTSSFASVDMNGFKRFPIPIPPLETQQKIVKILDKFTKLEATLEATLEAELALRKRQYQYYRDFLLDFENQIGGGIADGYKGRLKDVVWKTLGEVCENLDSMRKPITSNFRKAGNIPYYGASGIVDYVEDFILDGDYLLVSEDGANLLARKTPIAFSVSGKIWVNNHAHILKFRTYAERRFIEFYLNNIDISMYISGAAQPKLNKQNLNKIRIPIPPLPEQEKIVAILDKFDTLTHSVSEGLPHEIALRRKQYEYYLEQLLAFPKAA